MKVNEIPIKQNANQVTDPKTQVSAEEFNSIVDTVKNAVVNKLGTTSRNDELYITHKLAGDTYVLETSIPKATTSTPGIMSKDDKDKLDKLSPNYPLVSQTINGESYNVATDEDESLTIYAPTEAGQEGYILASTGSGAPQWIPQAGIKAGDADHARNADNATKASQDSAGNVITQTYATKAEVDKTVQEAKNIAEQASRDVAAQESTITDIQETIENISAGGGATNAASVTYNSAGCSLTSTNVQNALTEVAGRLDGLDKNESEELEIEKVLEQGLFITDKEGNVALKYDKHGLSVAKARPMPSTMIDVDMRLLIIGNSYSVDAVAYLPELLKGNGISFTIGVVYYSGQGIDAHIGAFDNEYAHEYYEYSSEVGYWQRLDNSSTKVVLSRMEWNAVFFHEVSSKSTNLTAIKKSLKQILEKVDGYISYETHYGYILTPAYGKQSNGYDKSMWNGINEVGKYLLNVEEIEFIVPIHTAIENARTNNLLQSFGADLMASASDRHIEDGIGRYIEACAMYTYLKQFFGNYKDVRDSSFVPKYGENVSDGYNSPSKFPQTSSFTEIDENEKRLAIKAALMAVAKPYNLSTI